MRKQRQPPTNCSVFFTGLPIDIPEKAVRKHFDSVGRVLDFRFAPIVAGKEFRYGEVDYADEKTAQEAIQRLNGHVFGQRHLRVTMVDTRFRKRGRRDQRPAPPPTTDDRGRSLMQFSKGFFDPILGREESMVLDVLKCTATEDAYEAVEQLRILALTRHDDAKNLLRENPALISALIMILQHARRIDFGPLPPEAFDSSTVISKEEKTTSFSPPEAKELEGGGGTAGDSEVEGKKKISVAQRQQAIATIEKMSDGEVERIWSLTPEDLAEILDPAVRQQMKVLQQCLLEMAEGV